MQTCLNIHTCKPPGNPMTLTPGKIFLSDQRGLQATPVLRRYSTFNFGPYYQEHKAPMGSLYGLNEEVLAGAAGIHLPVEHPSYLLLLPVTGALAFYDPQGKTTTVEVEEVLICELPANSTVRIRNPYTTEPITYIQIWIKATGPVATAFSRVLPFQIGALENQLAGIVAPGDSLVASPLPFAFNISRFAGRQEAVYKLKSKDSLFFAFVIAGAFECEGRLLHEKDGLALWDTGSVELEALSDNALMLVIELTNAGKGQG
jgi:hypothetical protein